ncbi:MAG: DUF5060 domain-containing protein, partial [Armatimonadetes bacterium]|nr:DUF5060 domain-containing protein [Armatimonadota bacterium]
MILSAVTLAVLGQPPLAEFPLNGLKVEVTPKGTLRVVAPDGLSADLAVVLWHGDWVYVHQGGQGARQAEKAANAVSVSGELADAQGKAVLNFTQSIVLADNKLCVEYEFRPLEGSKIVRGPLLLMTVDRKAFSGRRQFIPPGIAGRIPARRTGAGNEYWLEIAPGAAVVVRMEKETAIESQPAGGRYETRFSLPLGEGGGGKVAFTLAAEQMPATLPGEVSGDDRPLAIRAVTPAQAKVPRFGLYEATIDLAATYRNPFDPDDVAVDAYFTSPSGRELVVPCFYMIDFKRDVIGDAERLEAGGATWKLRFTPEEIGRYRFRILARDRSGQVEWHGGALDVTPSQLPGFVRVARRSPRYLELSTGQGIFPIGHNLPTYHVSRFLPDRELKKMRDGGENYNRWWMYSRELGLEWEHEPGWYRQASAWRMDYLLRLAEELGFWYMICFDTHQDFLGSESWQGWPNNPYNASLGGPCEKPSDFFASPAAKALYKKRLRYLVARYGWSTRILCWEFGNEFEGWPDTPPDVLLAWHREMSDYLRSIDPYKHLITTSFWTPAGRQEIWELDSIDIVQTHHYANVKVDMARLVAADCAEKYKKYRKPHIYG